MFVHALAFSPDGRVLAAASTDAVWLWRFDPVRTEMIDLRQTGRSGVLAFSPDGTTLACDAPGGGIQFLAIGPGAPVWPPLPSPGPSPVCAAFSPNGQLLAISCSDTRVRLWRLPEASLIHNLTGNSGPVTALAFSPDGRVLAATTADAQLQFWPLSDGVPMSIGIPDVLGARLLAYSSRSGRLALVSGGDTLSVTPDPFPWIEGVARLEVIASWPTGPFQIKVTGARNRPYTIERSVDLPDWTPWTNFTSTSRVMQIGDPDMSGPGRRFYRIVEP